METKAVRGRALSRLLNIDTALANRVAAGLGWREAPAAVPTRTDLPPLPPPSILAKARPTLEGRVVGCLVPEGADAAVLQALRDAGVLALDGSAAPGRGRAGRPHLEPGTYRAPGPLTVPGAAGSMA